MDEDQTNNQNEFLINYISENKEDKKLSNDQRENLTIKDIYDENESVAVRELKYIPSSEFTQLKDQDQNKCIDKSIHFIAEGHDSLKNSINTNSEDFFRNLDQIDHTFGSRIDYKDMINDGDTHEIDFKINKNPLNVSYSNKISTSKYTFLNCIPKILFEQFKKLANFYFLIIAILQVIREISISQGKPVILLPLMVVVTVNGIKDFLEDYKRKKSDDEENNKKSLVYNRYNKKFENKKWSDIKLGDIVKVLKDEYFPADLVLINTSEKEGECFIETKNLDGETNLKFKQSHHLIRKMFPNDESLNGFCGILTTKKPNQHIYEFEAVVHFDRFTTSKQNEVFIGKMNSEEILSNHLNKTRQSIGNLNADRNIILENNDINSVKENKCDKKFSNEKDMKNGECDIVIVEKNSFLLRGCSLKNSEFIIGIAVYVGHYTKIMKNSPNARYKTSKLDNMMNRQILVILLFQIFLSVLATFFYLLWLNENKEDIIYINPNPIKIKVQNFFYLVGTWILIFTNLVPISLLVSLEMIKYIQGIYICWDYEIFDEKQNISAKVQTSTLNEELGQVKYIFSDKTGTLTKNYMEFQNLSIGNIRYGKATERKCHEDKYGKITNFNCEDDNLIKHLSNKNHENHENIINYFICLATCHSIVVENKNNNLIYHSSSPDETALINCARKFGFVFIEKDCKNFIKLEMLGEIHKLRLLNVIEYSSERKMMSIILKFPDGKIVLYAKGADSTITSKLSSQSDYLKITDKYLSHFAKKGLRTLMVAYKALDEDQYNKWNEKLITLSLSNDSKKAEKLGSIYNEFEKDLFLLGSTGINDELQDDLQSTLDSFIKTGIKLWVLTGDKFDTAKSIAYSSKLISRSFEVFEFEESKGLDDMSDKIDECLIKYLNFKREKEAFISDNPSFAKKFNNNVGNLKDEEEIINKIKKINPKFNEILDNEIINNYDTEQKPICNEFANKQYSSNINYDIKNENPYIINQNQIINKEKINSNSNISTRKVRFENENELNKDEDCYRQSDSQKYIEFLRLKKKKFSIIISSKQLETIMKNKDLIDKFYKLSILCSSVICCRVSPNQKAEMVRFIKTHQPLSTTLAIGDGANDVNMICTADIGIGIYGVEGRQAARASDYSIAKFCFLKKLLYVHGRESYRKNSFVICYNFYKNVLFVLPQFWYGLSSCFSGQPLYDPWIYQLYNIVFSCLPIIWFGIYDKEEKHRNLMKDVHLYYPGMVGKLFHAVRFWKWIFYGTFQGYIIYLFCYIINDVICDREGYVSDLYSLGALSYLSVVTIVNFKILYATSSHTIYSILLVLLSVLAYIGAYLYMSNLISSPIFNTFNINMHNINSYAISLILMIICLLLDYGINKLLEIYGFMINPREIDPEKYENSHKLNTDELEKSFNLNSMSNNSNLNEISLDMNARSEAAYLINSPRVSVSTTKSKKFIE